MAEILDGDKDFDWHSPFKEQSIHFVCVASGGLTTCDLAAISIGKMNRHDEVWPLTRGVNDSGEAGTFHPRLPLTVLPQPYWNGRVESDLEAFLTKSFQDVAKANRDYVRLETMVIDLNGWGAKYPYKDARRIAVEVLSNDPSISKVIFLPDHPSE